LNKWVYVGLSSILSFFAGIGIVFLLAMGRAAAKAPAVRALYNNGFILGVLLFLIMFALGFLLKEGESKSDSEEEISFKDLVMELRETIRKASHSHDVRHTFTDYLKSMWVDESSKLMVERALKEVLDEFHDEAWLFALYAELLMSDGRWADAEVMIKRAWAAAPTDEYVRQVVREWIDARSEKDPFRVSEMVRKLREVYPEGWLYLLEAEHMMRIGRTGNIEEILVEAYKLSDDNMALLEIISAYLGYLASEGREPQMFAFFEKLRNAADKPLIYAIEAKLSVLARDYERAVDAVRKLKESGVSPEIVDAVIADIMNGARSDGREDILAKLFE